MAERKFEITPQVWFKTRNAQLAQFLAFVYWLFKYLPPIYIKADQVTEDAFKASLGYLLALW
jgi:hypothetical protein